ncbi:MAG: flavodoxin domain-containing protein [Eubacteriales bacterium]|nr:flavodoxin domain-containing protein [Eubacteriales bacterium]
MKTLIIYDSVFGNTEKLAKAMADALGAKAAKPADITPDDLEGLELLIAGSPTRAFHALPSVAGFIKGLKKGSLDGVKVAAFDTRISPDEIGSGALKKMVKMFGYAAEPILKALVKKGGAAVSAEGFFVTDTEGPLKNEEEHRAVKWAKEMA